MYCATLQQPLGFARFQDWEGQMRHEQSWDKDPANEVVNALRSEQVWPSNVRNCCRLHETLAISYRKFGRARKIWWAFSTSQFT